MSQEGCRGKLVTPAHVLESFESWRSLGGGQTMKNIQIIDRASNLTFSVFQAADDEFSAIFPGEGQVIEFIEYFIARCGGDDRAKLILEPVWERPILKRDALGIHGTLYYAYEDRRQCLPATKREVDRDEGAINSAQIPLFASKR
jgi:hypothetical protein